MNIRKGTFVLRSRNNSKKSSKWLLRGVFIGSFLLFLVVEWFMILQHAATTTTTRPASRSRRTLDHDHKKNEPRWKPNPAAKFLRQKEATTTTEAPQKAKQQRETVEEKEKDDDIDEEEIKEKELAMESAQQQEDIDEEEIKEKELAMELEQQEEAFDKSEESATEAPKAKKQEKEQKPESNEAKQNTEHIAVDEDIGEEEIKEKKLALELAKQELAQTAGDAKHDSDIDEDIDEEEMKQKELAMELAQQIEAADKLEDVATEARKATKQKQQKPESNETKHETEHIAEDEDTDKELIKQLELAMELAQQEQADGNIQKSAQTVGDAKHGNDIEDYIDEEEIKQKELAMKLAEQIKHADTLEESVEAADKLEEMAQTADDTSLKYDESGHYFSTIDSTKYPHTAALPKWIQSYIQWHAKMREKYPGKQIFLDPDAPKILIRTCLGLCGGLHDRLGQLPWDLYLANQTQRILFIQWERPAPLQEFLMPSELLDWTVPPGIYRPSKPGKVSEQVRAIPQLFGTNCTQELYETNPEPEFWNHDLDICLQQAKQSNSSKVLRHRILGHLDEAVLEKRLMDLGETDLLHWKSSFGHLFWSMFQPSPNVQKELDQIHEELNITENSYSAVHCRVRHPKATPPKIFVKGKNANYPADKTGLPWVNQTRDFAIATASKALQCAKLHMPGDDDDKKKEPLYFFSDSNDLVRFISHELTSPKFLHKNSSLLVKGTYDQDALKQVQSLRVVSRSSETENAHIDRQKGRPPEAYYGTFVDLWIAIQARCVTYGIGYFALFATKLVVGDPKKCELPYVYQEEAWGGRAGTKKGSQTCPVHDSKYDDLWK